MVLPPDGALWGQLAADAQGLANAGFTAVWLPPAYKGQRQFDVGYGVYDLFDLGEFPRRGPAARSTARASSSSPQSRPCGRRHAGLCRRRFQPQDGGDAGRARRAQIVDWDDRNQPRSEWHEIGAWTRFTFPGRGAAHSSMDWHADHFDALSFNADTNNGSRLYRLKDKHFRPR